MLTAATRSQTVIPASAVAILCVDGALCKENAPSEQLVTIIH